MVFQMVFFRVFFFFLLNKYNIWYCISLRYIACYFDIFIHYNMTAGVLFITLHSYIIILLSIFIILCTISVWLIYYLFQVCTLKPWYLSGHICTPNGSHYVNLRHDIVNPIVLLDVIFHKLSTKRDHVQCKQVNTVSVKSLCVEVWVLCIAVTNARAIITPMHFLCL